MKKYLFQSLFILSFSVVFAQTVSESLGGAERYINEYVPAMFRPMIQEYLKVIGVTDVDSRSIGGSNRGIKRYNESIRDNNPCFNSLLREFRKKEENYYGRVRDIENRLNRTTSVNSDPKNGWYWNLAMRMTNNDSNLAMMLVGQCGHDDVAIGFCGQGMRGHPRYTQGSLGEETILPGALRDEVSRIQAPNMGASSLPSKYYHTIGASYATCALVRSGVPGFIVRRIQGAAANTYRMMRLCNSIGENKDGLFRLARKFESILSSSRFDEGDLVRIILLRGSQFREEFEGIRDSERKLYSSINDVRGYFRRREWITEEIIREKFSSLLSFNDATNLFSNHVLNGERCMQPQISKDRIDRVKRVATNRRLKCDGISESRCEKAKGRLLTWWADFEWTEGQHLKGAEFAINNCKKEPDFLENLNQRSCEAVKRYNEIEALGGVGEDVEP